MLDIGEIKAEQLSDPLEKISTQAVRAGEVIRRLRSFIKKSDIGMEIIDGNQLVAEVVKLAEVDAKKHGTPVTLNLHDNLPLLRADQ